MSQNSLPARDAQSMPLDLVADFSIRQLRESEALTYSTTTVELTGFFLTFAGMEPIYVQGTDFVVVV
jgi:hypothetical protein